MQTVYPVQCARITVIRSAHSYAKYMLMHTLCIIGPSGVRALPLGVAAERSVHYIWYYL